MAESETSTGMIILIIMMIFLFIWVLAITGLLIAVYYKEIPIVFGPTGPPGPAGGPTGPTGIAGPTGPRASSLTGIQPPGQRVSLMHWNPHWQCTTKTCCSNVAVPYINNNIMTRNVDFTNIIELDTLNYTPPQGYVTIEGKCGTSSVSDKTTLIYNATRWQPIGNHRTFCINDTGTIGSSGRPTVIQRFRSLSNPSFNTYVIGSHYTHFRDNYIRGLNQALTSMGITASDTIIFMGDTNQSGSSEQLMIDMLQGTPPIIKASRVHGTCCYNGPNSSFNLPYDRIITTFGSSISTDLPTFNDVIPNPIAGCNYAEMHLPVFSIVNY